MTQEQGSITNNLREEVLARLPEQALNATEAWQFISGILADVVVDSFFLTVAPIGYEPLKPKAQVVVSASGLLFDFIFADDVQRYDVSAIKDIARIEERREREISVEGGPRHKVSASVEWQIALSGISLDLVAYGHEGEQVSEFLRLLRRRVFGA